MSSRREMIEMTPDELRRFIATEKTLIIVSNGPGGFPHPLPMFFTVDDANRFYVTTFRKSQKVVNFRRDPKASLLIESGKVYEELRAVLAYATAEILDDPALTQDIMVKIGTKGLSPRQVDSPALRAQAQATAPKRVVIRFTPETFITWDHSKLGGTY